MSDLAQIPSITFFFPYREVSGVPVLFRRMAEYLANNYGLKIYLIDYADGYMARSLAKETSVQLINFEDRVPVEIPEDTILVMQSILPYTMRPELKVSKHTRIVFWTLYPLNLIPTIIPLQWFRHLQARYIHYNKLVMNTILRSLRNDLRDLIHQMSEKGSIFFMDGTTSKHTVDRLSLTIENPIFIPVVCDEPARNIKALKASENGARLNFCWLGRLADFKIHILIYTIKKLSEHARTHKQPIGMHIIGDGPLAHKLSELQAEHEYFQLIFAGTLTGAARDKYLVENVDVLTAMGTSALDGARLGVPTILLDVSYGTIKHDYKFKWLFETDKFCLGEMIDKNSYERNNQSLELAISELSHNYLSLSDKSYEYCVTHHGISSVCRKFLDALQEASFTYGDFSPKVLQKTLFRKTYEAVRSAYRSFNF